jgi:hypothetical protein
VELLLYRGRYEVPIVDVDGQLKTETLPYDIKCQHFAVNRNTYVTCTSGLQEYRDQDGDITIAAGEEPCVPCYHYLENGKDGGIAGPRKLHIFNAILLADFHEVPGTRPIRGKPGKFWPEKVKCTGRRCMHCKDGVEKNFGHRVYIPLGTNFAQSLAEYDLFTLSGMCKCGGTLEPVAFACSDCNAPYKNFEDTGCSDDELKALREEYFTCPSCSHLVAMNEYSECSSCNLPQALTMWTAALEMYRSGEGVNTSLVISNARPVSETEMGKIKELLVPTDTTKSYPVLSPRRQADKLGVTNPYGEEEKTGRGAADYNTGAPAGRRNEVQREVAAPAISQRQADVVMQLAVTLGYTEGDLNSAVESVIGKVVPLDNLTPAQVATIIGSLKQAPAAESGTDDDIIPF